MSTAEFIKRIRSNSEGKRSLLTRKISFKERDFKISSTLAPKNACLKRTTLLSLDDDLLNRIFESLDLVDKVCLSLICKRFLDLFGAITKQPCLAFPKLLSLRVPIMCVNSEDIPRNKLLLRLENEKHAYCGDCLKLCPRKEFDQAALGEPSLERRCKPDAGIVDLCPCIALTTRDRDKVINLLRSSSPSHETKYGSFGSGPAGQPGFFHTCSTCFGPHGNIEIVMWLYLQSSGCLFAQSEYTITAPNHPRHPAAGPIFACPHKDIMSLAHSKSRFALCSECGTFMSRVSESKDSDTLVIQVRRPLEGYGYVTESIWSKASWRNNCRLNRSLFVKNRVYWSQSQHIKVVYGHWETKYCSVQKDLRIKLPVVTEEKQQPQQTRKGPMPSTTKVSSRLEAKNMLKPSQSFVIECFNVFLPSK